MADEVVKNVETQDARTQQNAPVEIDLSPYYSDTEAGKFDENKIERLVKDYQNAEKSKSYFQGLYYKKNNVPENIDGYVNSFKADSSYEKFMEEDESIKNSIKNLREFGIKEKIGTREMNAITDFLMKELVTDGTLDTRTDEQKQLDYNKARDAEIEKTKPILSSLNRSKEDNDNLLTKFFDSPSVYTADPVMKQTLMNLANSSGEGYTLATLIMENTEHQGIPVVTGTIETKDKRALMAEIQKLDDPELIDAKLKEFYGDK